MKLKTLLTEVKKKKHMHPPIVRKHNSGYRMPFVQGGSAEAHVNASLGDAPAAAIGEVKGKCSYLLETDDGDVAKTKFSMLRKFTEYALKNLGITTPVRVTVTNDRGSYALKTMAAFDPSTSHCVVYGSNRNTADIARSLAHELVHKQQLDNDKIKGPVQDIGGEIEDEANAVAGQLVKAFGYKFPKIFQQ